ncbi:hypothetical protein [Pseudomonas sp. 22 E 5]|nr:hypothetical protein [Pseudomonas sp. 22 E 5]
MHSAGGVADHITDQVPAVIHIHCRGGTTRHRQQIAIAAFERGTVEYVDRHHWHLTWRAPDREGRTRASLNHRLVQHQFAIGCIGATASKQDTMTVADDRTLVGGCRCTDQSEAKGCGSRTLHD